MSTLLWSILPKYHVVENHFAENGLTTTSLAKIVHDDEDSYANAIIPGTALLGTF